MEGTFLSSFKVFYIQPSQGNGVEVSGCGCVKKVIKIWEMEERAGKISIATPGSTRPALLGKSEMCMGSKSTLFGRFRLIFHLKHNF